MQPPSIFIRKLRSIPEVRKSALINDWERIQGKRGVGQQVQFALKHMCSLEGEPGWGEGVVWAVQPQDHFVIFTLIQAWKQYFQPLTDTKFLYRYEHYFFLKASNLIINWVHLSLERKNTHATELIPVRSYKKDLVFRVAKILKDITSLFLKLAKVFLQ